MLAGWCMLNGKADMVPLCYLVRSISNHIAVIFDVLCVELMSHNVEIASKNFLFYPIIIFLLNFGIGTSKSLGVLA